MKLDINMGSIWTMITTIVIAVAWMFTSFVSADENDRFHTAQAVATSEFRTGINYGLYYDLLEKWQAAKAEGNEDFANELSRQLERIKAQICEEDPKWERCKD